MAQAEAKAYAQEEKILEWFKTNPNEERSPSDIHKLLFTDATPLTSVRRGVTNLTKKGFLVKTDKFQTGVWGKKEFKWRLQLKNLSPI